MFDKRGASEIVSAAKKSLVGTAAAQVKIKSQEIDPGFSLNLVM